tara:strand:- start:314 stop:652 length:339 start_codon:yes stop_codon:yes gene_type:complete
MEEGKQMNIVAQSISEGIKLPSIIDNVSECAEKKRLLVQLVSGLLASGHYTEIATHEEYASGHPITEPRLKTYEVDWEDWKEAGYARCHPYHVIEDAESLLGDIEFYAKKEA